MRDKPNPAATSGDYDAMITFWQLVDDILGGIDTIRKPKHLPQLPNETNEDYNFRLKNAKLTNVYRDIVENLSQRPFASEVKVSEDGAPDEIVTFAEDVDGMGNTLHNFAGDLFFGGINRAIEWILVDYTSGVPEGATRAQEAAIGARPYWVKYPATAVYAAYTDIIDGAEQFVHVRIDATESARDGFGETRTEKVRVFNRERLEDGTYAPATWELWRKLEKVGQDGSEWLQEVPPTPLSIGIIPLVPFITGRRKGSSWSMSPPMRDAAELQIELFQQESDVKHLKRLTGHPMLAGNGVAPPLGQDGSPKRIPTGPGVVLYAPPSGAGSGGSWSFIEPSGTSLNFLGNDVKETIKELRELGRGPLTAQSGNTTVINSAVAAQKGNTAIQAWAINLKEALEQALLITAMWLRIEGYKPNVEIDTDFDVSVGLDDGFTQVLEMFKNGIISRDAVIDEAKRRNLLQAGFSAEKDADKAMADLGFGVEGGMPDGTAEPGGRP